MVIGFEIFTSDVKITHDAKMGITKIQKAFIVNEIIYLVF
jgi:predicted RNA-binding protein with TRAM domain